MLYSMVLCAETCYKSPPVPGRRICLPLFPSDLWNRQQMSDLLLHPPCSGQPAAWARFDPKTHKLWSTPVLSEMAFYRNQVWIKQVKTLVNFVQLCSRGVISVSSLTLPPNKANEVQ